MAIRKQRTPLRGEATQTRAATANDVARVAGVSQSAVSRAFTKGASVSARTRSKIEEAAKRLGYRPNLLARSLIMRRSHIIGVAIAYMDNQFYPQLLQALSAGLHADGYRILLFTPDLAADADPVLEEVLRYQVDALVLCSTMLSSRIADECVRVGVPVVLVNRKARNSNASSVTGDNRRGGKQIADFLLAGGHQRLAFIAGLEDSSTSRDRETAFKQRLAQAGVDAPARAVGNYTFEGARAATRTLLSSPRPPDAIFCANDHMAFAAIETARAEFNLDVGKNISIVGFDDVGVAGWPSFSLTTFSQPVADIADRVITILEALLRGEEGSQEVVSGQLVVRHSARRPRSGVQMERGILTWKPLSKTTA